MFYPFIFFFNQKTSYELRISDWSSDVCSSDLHRVETALRDQLETLERIPDRGVETAQQQERAFGRIDADPRRPPRRHRGDEVQAGGGHDAQCSLGAAQPTQSVISATDLVHRTSAAEGKCV